MHVHPLLALIIGLVGLWATVLALLLVLRPRGVPARDILKLVPDVLRLLRALLGDRRTPLDVRVVLVGMLAWIISPIDLIPEFVPVLGPLDDVVVAIVALRYVRRGMGVQALDTKWGGSATGFALLLRAIGSGS